MREEEVKQIISRQFRDSLKEQGIEGPNEFAHDFTLLESGLDSMAFAILVTTLESELGYDPFILLDEPVYPRTYGEFEAVYCQFSDHYKP